MGTDSSGLPTESIESDTGEQGGNNITDSTPDSILGLNKTGPGTLLPGHSQSVVTSSCKTTIVQRNKTMMEVSPAISSQVITTSPQTSEISNVFSTSEQQTEAADSTGTASKIKILAKTESISTTSVEEIPVEISRKGPDLMTEITISETTDNSITLEKEVSITQAATTMVYGSMAGVSTFGSANLKILTSTKVPEEIIEEKQVQDTSSLKPAFDKSTVSFTTLENPITGSSILPVKTPTTPIAMTSFSNISTKKSSEPSPSGESTMQVESTMQSPVISVLPISSSSSASVLKDFITTCKTTYIPSNRTSAAPIYTHISSASSISPITKPSLNTVSSSSTSIPSVFSTNTTSSSTTDQMNLESSTMISTSQKSIPMELETSNQQIKTTKKFELTTRKFMTRKKPTMTPSEIFSISTTTDTAGEVTTQMTSKIISSEITESNLGIITDMKTTLIASIPITTPTLEITTLNKQSSQLETTTEKVEYEKISTVIPISIISSESTHIGAKSTTFSNISTTEITGASHVTALITSEMPKDHATIISTQTTTCRTTTVGTNTSSTCKTTIPPSKSISVSHIPPTSFSAQLPIQVASTSTTTYKTTIPTAKFSFISTKESTRVSSFPFTSDIISTSMGQATQTSSIKSTEPTAMTTLPNIEFISFSPGLNITSSIPSEATIDLSKTTSGIKDLVSPTVHFTSTISDQISDIAQAPLSSQLDSSSSITSQTTSITQKIISEIEKPHKESTYPTSTPFKTNISSDISLISTTMIPSEIRQTSIFESTIIESSTVSGQKTYDAIQSSVPISSILISTEPTIASQTTTTCRVTDSSYKPIDITCKTIIYSRDSSLAPVSVISPITSSQSVSEKISCSTIPAKTTLLSSTFQEKIPYSSSVLLPTTTCRTTDLYTNTILPTTTCKTTIPTTKSIATQTTCQTTILGSVSTELHSTTTCRTTTLSNPKTTNKTAIPLSMSTTEKISIISTDSMDQMSTDLIIHSTTNNKMVISTDKFSIPLNSSTDIISPTTTKYGTIIDVSKNITEQWSQWTSIPITTTFRTTTVRSASTITSSTCETTIYHRQSDTQLTSSSAIAPLSSKVTDVIPEITTTSVIQFSGIQKPASLSPVSTSTTIPQTQISMSSLSDLPISTTCKITVPLESTLPSSPLTTICRTTLPTTKLSIPITTTCKTTAMTDTGLKTASSIIEASLSIEPSSQLISSTIKSTTPTSQTQSTSQITSTNQVLPSTVIVPSITMSKYTSSSNIGLSLTNTPQITTTCRTTLLSTHPSISTCKTTYIDRLSSSITKVQETTYQTKKIDSMDTSIPLSSTLCKTDCILGSTITSTHTESGILPEEQVTNSSTSSELTFTKINESYVSNESTLFQTTTTCRTTTTTPITTTCRTTIPSTDTTTSTCKTVPISKITLPSTIVPTDLSSTVTYQTPSSSDDIHTSAAVSIPSFLSTESNIESSSPLTFTLSTSTKEPYTESVTLSPLIIISSTQKPEELSEISALITSSSSETTTCKTTYSSSHSTGASSCKTTINLRKLPASSSKSLVTLITQQPIISSPISVSSLAYPLPRVNVTSSPTYVSTSYSIQPDQEEDGITTGVASNWPITNSTLADSSSTITGSISSAIPMTSYSVVSLITSIASKALTETSIFTTKSPTSTISPPSDYEANISLIPQEDSTILEQLSTKILPGSQDHTISQIMIPSSTCKTTILGSDTTSTCKTTITAHSFEVESKGKTASSNTISMFTSEAIPSTQSSNLIVKEPTSTTCRTTQFLTQEPTVTTCRTTVTEIILPSTTTCRTTIHTIIPSFTSTSKIFISTPLPLTTASLELLPTTTTCRTTLPSSLFPTTSTCKTTIPTLLPTSTTCKTTIPTLLPTSTTCKTTIPTFSPTVIPTTTCKTTIPTIFHTTSTCKTTIPTEFPTITISEAPIITLFPVSDQNVSSFGASISSGTSQVSSFSSSTEFLSSSGSSAPILKEFNNTCKTTVVSRSDYLQSTSFEATTPSLHIGPEKEHTQISTQFLNELINFTTSSIVSKTDQIPTSTSLSLTEGLSSRLSTFISSLLPSDWQSSQNLPTSTYPADTKQTDITAIFLSSLEPNKDITSTHQSSLFNFTSSPRNSFITDMAGQMFTFNVTTATASTYVTDIHGYIISSNIPPTELSNIIKASTVSVTPRTTFRSHRGSTLVSTNVFSETTTLSAISAIYSTPPCRSTAINGTGKICISTTTFDLTSYTENKSITESTKDTFESRNGTIPLSKPKPCLCINWYLICLIFTIAFIFAWCLLCWQKMLL